MSLYKRQGSKVWWCRFGLNGKDHRQSTGETNRRAAEAAERRIRTIRESQAPSARKSDIAKMAAADLSRAVAEGCDEGRKETLSYIWKNLQWFEQSREVTEMSLREYVKCRREAGVRGQTIRRELQALKRGLKLIKRHVPDEWPKIRTDAPSQSKRGKLHPTADIMRWLAELPEEAQAEARFVMFTGLRAYEVKRLEPSWIEQSPAGDGFILRVPPHASKTRQERIVGLSTEAMEILIENKGHFSKEDHRNSRKAACKRLGIAHIHLRDLRHWFATTALQITGDAAAVQAALGHSDLRTTQMYQSSTVARAVMVGNAAVVGMVGGAPC